MWEEKRTETELRPAFWKEPKRTGTDMPKHVKLDRRRSRKREEPEPN